MKTIYNEKYKINMMISENFEVWDEAIYPDYYLLRVKDGTSLDILKDKITDLRDLLTEIIDEKTGK